ncbi:MAG: mannose-1-phosphate guanylyltransferase/mannose-6-phosphate isomerase [Pseudomonadota bacterium]|nr:mannose-1-phosphate guanylyltransferase/mannose-6-phosphate isomerase [Pseudomonadota bacterium]
MLSLAPSIIPVILCGGNGEGLWPLSRASHSKHLARLRGQPSLLEQTVQRLAKACPTAAPIVLCNETDRFLVAEQVTAHAPAAPRILLEPERRDTSAAIALAVAAAGELDPAAILLVCPADHVIADIEGFAEAVRRGVAAAQAGRIVTFGIVPDRPHAGYGYLKVGDAIPGTEAQILERFVEKPDEARAAEMLAEGGCLWNAGIFLFRAEVMRAALEAYTPGTWTAARAAYFAAVRDLDFIRIDRDAYAAAPKISIDYAVLEKADNLAIVPARFDWNDVGSWSVLASLFDGDPNGNAVHGKAVLTDTCDSFVYSGGDALVATLGVRDLIVSVTKDAVLVCPKDRADDLKEVVASIRADGHPEADHHKLVYRPWGSYESLVFGDRFQVKHIVVKPGGVLSLQRHYHRAEHWVVVRGTAKVTIGNSEELLAENQSVYVPLGSMHRLENPGKIPLELIEVQTGSYLGEDDIVRFADVYSRA